MSSLRSRFSTGSWLLPLRYEKFPARSLRHALMFHRSWLLLCQVAQVSTIGHRSPQDQSMDEFAVGLQDGGIRGLGFSPVVRS